MVILDYAEQFGPFSPEDFGNGKLLYECTRIVANCGMVVVFDPEGFDLTHGTTLPRSARIHIAP